MPGIARSDPYSAVPVTFGTPSGRTGRVPTHLNCFAVSREVMSSTATSPDCRIAQIFRDLLVRKTELCERLALREIGFARDWLCERLALRESCAGGAQMQV